jgi:hypothetical protein
MLYITMTELRTKTAELADNLLRGVPMSIIHRSKIIGYIQPAAKEPKVFRASQIVDAVKKLGLHGKPVLSEREYEEHLREKYGQDLS